MKNKLILLLLLSTGVSLYAQSLLSPELLWQLGRVSDARISPDGSQLIYSVRRYSLTDNKSQADIYIRSLKTEDTRILLGTAEDESSPRWRADGKAIGFLMNDRNGDTQLWEVMPDGSAKTQVSFVKGGIENFGYSSAMDYIWFSARVKLDEKPSEIYPDLPKTDGARIIDGLMFRHWNAWNDYTYSHVFVCPYRDGKLSGSPRDIMQGEKFHAPMRPFGVDEQIAFSHDGKKIAYTCKKETGTASAYSTNSDIYLYDLMTLSTTNLTQGMPGYDINPVFSPDGSSLLFQSMEEAGNESDRNRLFEYTFASSQRKELLPSFDYNVEAKVWSADAKKIYLLANVNATKQIYIVDRQPKSKKPFYALTNVQADYSDLQVQGIGKNVVIIAGKQSHSRPNEIYRININDGSDVALSRINDDQLSRVQPALSKKRMVKTSDGKDMLVWVIYPPGFDSTKKYPTLLYCQGGPQSTVSQFYSFRWNFSLMASQGYIVVAPNRRGLPGFGEAWNDQITGDWGGQAMRDLLSAIDDVSREPYVDKNRLGCVGASYGGYSAFWLAGNHQKRFKTFIAHCGVFNMTSMYGSTEEMFFNHHDNKGPYWQKPMPDNYSKYSPHLYVQNWDSPILIIHNEKDYRVPLTQGLEAFTAAQELKLESRLLYFPDEGHHVLKPQNAILWQRVFFDWLDKYLKPSGR